MSDDSAELVVVAPSRQYRILAGYGSLGHLPLALRSASVSGRLRLVSDETVFSLYGQRVVEVVQRGGYEVAWTTVPAGESSKSLQYAASLYDWLADTGTDRRDCLLALGGGVVGDLAGFVAATYMRGIALVQVPTTLLAQVDSSIGGKVGINLPRGKNLVGAFHQPVLVLADTATLDTLPRRELVAGWAEVVKTAMILDADLFSTLEDHVRELLHLQPSIVERVVRRCMELKASVVAQDEREAGLRAILNYGHTIGHALEAAGGFRHLLHGEAVAIGMVGAASIAVQMGMLDPAAASRQNSLLRALGLPDRCPGADLQQVRRSMTLDKKVRQGRLTWVLPTSIGHVVQTQDVPVELVDQVLESLVQE